MKARRRQSQVSAVNFWPGYVDALTNVVLNLVFLIAIFGTALAVINSMPQATGTGSGRADESPQRVQVTVNGGMEGGATLLGTGGAIGLGQSNVALATVAPGATRQVGPRPGQGLVPRPSPALDAGSGGAFAPTKSGPATGARGTLAVAGSRERAEAVGATTLSRRNDARVATEARPSGGPSGGARLADAQPGVVQPGAGRQGGGYPFAGLPDGPLSFAVVDAYQRRFMPGVRLVPRPAPGGGQLLTIGLAVGTEPVAALRQPAFRTTLRALLSNGGGPALGRVRLWTATRLADPILRRTAYLALIEARSQLLALGYPAAAIELRLTEGSAATADEKQIYLLATPANSN